MFVVKRSEHNPILIPNRDQYWEEFATFIAAKPPDIELICTGRGAPSELLERADYVTEFRKLKHPMDKGQAARMGIEM